jgi:hypothetical protein
MRIQLKKGRDGPSTLACVRADGTRTWSKVHPFFPEHDLTHCSVESVLGFTEAFFGLIASGWNIDDFAVRGTAKRIPTEAIVAENIVGLLDLERAQRERFPAEEFNSVLTDKLAPHGNAPTRPITEAHLERIRALRADLVSRWWSVADGGTFEIEFPAALVSA